MIIEPKAKGFLCITAHPDGCKETVKRQISYTKTLAPLSCPKKVLILGCSGGYGLSTRIAAAFGGGAATLGVMFDKPETNRRTATPGWYQNKAFEEAAQKEGLYAKTLNMDAYSDEAKAAVIDAIRQDLGTIDMVVYSLAAPRRACPDGTIYNSCLKTIGDTFTSKNWDFHKDFLSDIALGPASEEEIYATVKVMGGEDWYLWMKALKDADVLSANASSIAFSYLGPELTAPIYSSGTIGMAKKDLHQTAATITEQLQIASYISVNKAVVTQASSAIPVVPLYLALLFKVMKEQGLHEGCIEQMTRFFAEKWQDGKPLTDEQGLIRLDDREMKEEVQSIVASRFAEISDDKLAEWGDLEEYRKGFWHLYGFSYDNVDYTKDYILGQED